jgi:hypothetical protein
VPFLIDGDNLLGTWKRPRSDAERRRLAFEIARLARTSRKRMICVFDGQPQPSIGSCGNDVKFSGAGRSADDLILQLLREQSERRSWIVVTSDRSLGDRCRWLEARIERCDLFRRRLTTSEPEHKPETEDDIDYWLEQFGEGKAD